MIKNRIGTTRSVCPVCLSVIDADKVEKEIECEGTILHGIFMDKTCPDHGSYSTLIWEGDSRSYFEWNREKKANHIDFHQTTTTKGCPYDCGICPEHSQLTCCVLLELTNTCNLHCPVCFASAGESDIKEPTLNEISSYYDILLSNGGPYNIQLSGGEPTLREDLCQIISLGIEKGFPFIQLNTNGLLLASDLDLASKLKQAGLSCVFLQFDGITDRPYEILRGRPLLREKQKAIDNCARASLGVVLVPTLVPDVNDHEIGGILRFALERLPSIRGVHFQPVSYFGRCGMEAPVRRLTIPRVLAKIEEQTYGVLNISDFQGGGAEHSHCSFHGNFMKLTDGSVKPIKNTGEDCGCTSRRSRDFVSRRWSCAGESCKKSEESDVSSLDEFLSRIENYTLAVSGMVFQDACNLDLERLKSCYICEISTEGKQIPFCAYNLTSLSGKSLYRT